MVSDQMCGALLLSCRGLFCLTKLVLWGEAYRGVTIFHNSFSLLAELLSAHPWICLHCSYYSLVGLETWSQMGGFLPCILTSDCSHHWVSGACVHGCLTNMELLVQVTKEGSSRPPLFLGR